MLKTNVESLVKMKLRGEIIHPELQVERNYATIWDGRPKVTVGIASRYELFFSACRTYADSVNAYLCQTYYPT